MPVELKIPSVGESITEVVVGAWRKSVGDAVEQDEDVVELETDKATFDLPAPAAGVITQILKKSGEAAAVGDVIGYVGEAGEREVPAQKPEAAPAAEPAARASPQPAESKPAAASGASAQAGKKPTAGPAQTPPPRSDKAGDRKAEAAAAPPARAAGASKTEAPPQEKKPPAVEPSKPQPSQPAPAVRREAREDGRPAEATREAPRAPQPAAAGREERVVAMSPIRRRIAQRLVEARQTAALLTTFNEIDMSAVIALRKKYRDAFQERYAVKLGFMSFFVKAVVEALSAIPQVNSEVRGSDIVYRNYFDIGIAVGGGKGLVVPVLRNAERLSFAEIERAVADFARRAEQNQLKVDELQGGTFTISNGGVYGSLMSTPIVNPPQSGVLGMHAIQDRPVVREGNIVIRPMMYVALTYDHRVVDGREAVTFLTRVREIVEEPSRLLIEV